MLSIAFLLRANTFKLLKFRLLFCFHVAIVANCSGGRGAVKLHAQLLFHWSSAVTNEKSCFANPPDCNTKLALELKSITGRLSADFVTWHNRSQYCLFSSTLVCVKMEA